MCRLFDYPSHSHIHLDGCIDSFTINNFDFNSKIESTMSVGKTKKTKRRTYKLMLETIPEEREICVDNNDNDIHPEELEKTYTHLEIDLQVLRKYFDMGLCVLCFSLGYMVSTKFHPRPKFSSFL
ncbi:hypothetical protein MtrunA17_Chr2g0318361 [Medicago truncatula]|uniref:Uncharacterized protein n=1 Tax=Medicago truncatula TaxID=3880 RepID=A0A396JEU7_MEDTR|nr:hypothetical protein MtrunA17_Chr2g0318361 [Medicago truncatula]